MWSNPGRVWPESQDTAEVVVRGVEKAPGSRTSDCVAVLASSTKKRGPTVFAGFGVGPSGAQSGAVPLGAMQLSRCPDRPRLDEVTMPDEDPVPTQIGARPRNLGKSMGGRGLSPASVHRLWSLSLFLSLCLCLCAATTQERWWVVS